MALDSFDNYNEANVESIRKHLEQELLDDTPRKSFRMMERSGGFTEVHITEESRRRYAELLFRPI